MHPDALAARLACILLGYLFGSFLTAEVVARAVHGGRQCAGYWHRQPRHG